MKQTLKSDNPVYLHKIIVIINCAARITGDYFVKLRYKGLSFRFVTTQNGTICCIPNFHVRSSRLVIQRNHELGYQYTALVLSVINFDKFFYSRTA